MIKYASNSFLATKISFINEMATLCESLGANVEVVAQGMGLDSRIGRQFLNPGPGFGGSCFPKDTSALAHIGRRYGVPLRIVESVLEVNEAIKRRMVSKVEAALGGLENKTVAILGLSFKPDTDDVRDSPALPIIEGLLAHGARVRAYDPAAMTACREILPQVTYCNDPYDCAQSAHGLVIVTEWNQFRKLGLAPDLPGCIATGSSQPEVEKAIHDAIAFHLDGMREDGQQVPSPSSYSTYVEMPA